MDFEQEPRFSPQNSRKARLPRTSSPGEKSPIAGSSCQSDPGTNDDLAREWDSDHDKHVVQKLLAIVQPDFNPTTWAAFQRFGIDGLPAADYIAPEQIRDAKSADIRADIYSLGCTFYYLLSGGPPFRGDHLWDVYQAHFSMDAGPLNLLRPEVPVELAAVVAKMMAKEPARRFQTPGEVSRALTPFFKPAATQSAGPSAGMPRVETQVAPTPPTSAPPSPPQPATPASIPAPAGRRTPKAKADEVAWGTLIEIKEDGPLLEPVKPKRLEQKPQLAESPFRRPPWFRGAAAAAALLVGVIVALSLVLTVRTKEGYLVFSDLPEHAVVTVDDKVITVNWPGGKGPLKVTVVVGDHTVKVELNGIEVRSGEVNILAGEKKPIWVGLVSTLARRRESEVVTESNPWPEAARPAGQKLLFDGRLMTMSPDCRRAAVVMRSNTERIVDAPDAAKVVEIDGHQTDFIFDADFSPDGSRLASTGGNDNFIKIWDTVTGTEVRRLGLLCVRLTFSPDGTRLASGGGVSKVVTVWDIATGEKLHAFRADSKHCWCVAFSPDGKWLANGGLPKSEDLLAEDGSVGERKLWDLGTGAGAVLRGHVKGVHGVAFSPDGKRLASASIDKTAKVWDVATRNPVATFGGHRVPVHSVRFSPDGRLVSSIGRENHVRVWEAATGHEVAALAGLAGHPQFVQFSPEGRWIYAGSGNTLKAWETPTANPPDLARYDTKQRPPNAATGDKDRRAATKVLSLGGSVTIRVNGKTRDIVGRQSYFTTVENSQTSCWA